ncbi:MAG TPA: glucose-6-phosphate isomerase, partial [Chitinophagales bacterium]|nr:glucose-6-phosphate isomerase [Chitinophagales bacterium]
MIPSESFRDSIIYKALTDDAERLKQMHLRQLFQDEERFASMSIFWDELLFDFSKNRIDSKAWKNLHRLAEEMQLTEAFEGMLRGDKINVTEGRPVLH